MSRADRYSECSPVPWSAHKWSRRTLGLGLLTVLATLGLFASAQARVTVTAAAAPTKLPDNPAPGDRTVRFAQSQALVSEGRSLFENACSSCHGIALQGRPGVAPALRNVGAGPIDFYLSTGRMPLANPSQEPARAPSKFQRKQIAAVIAFVTSLSHATPTAPTADASAGNLSTGMQVFTENCAGCHQMVARGGLTVGAWVPSLENVNQREIAEAVRMGPYLMPHFNSRQINQHQLDSLARYVLWTKHPDNAGGWGIGNLGPIPEGIIAWFVGLLALVIVARLIGERTGGRNQ